MASIVTIPTEMLLTIFTFLSRSEELGMCQRVCKVWNKTIAEHAELWKYWLEKLNPQLSNSENPKRDLIHAIKADRAKYLLPYPLVPPMKYPLQTHWTWCSYHQSSLCKKSSI